MPAEDPGERKTVRLVLSYDGTDFVGWQAQPAQRNVQEVLEAAIWAIDPRASRVRGASRTDSGVHAEGQVVAFDSAMGVPLHGWVRGLNGKLPQDVAVVEAQHAPLYYSPRYDALAKTYRYLLHVGQERDPLWRRRAWHICPRRARPRPGGIGPVLDLDRMEAAMPHLVGTHDFRAFRSVLDTRDATVRTLSRVEMVRGFGGARDVVAIEVRGNAFLQHMIRILVGTLLEVGRERLAPDAVPGLLTPTSERTDTGETAPAHGLCLVNMELGRAELEARAAGRTVEWRAPLKGRPDPAPDRGSDEG
ncbi:MAG: tRNA pseudouridine(38-40) synthase TruA [Sandaracinaceae bacterium]